LLARINREKDKSAVFSAKAAPKIAKTGRVKPLGDWMLNDFIRVLFELKLITVSATGSQRLPKLHPSPKYRSPSCDEHTLMRLAVLATATPTTPTQ
jgi:hypothetical protein